MSKDRSTEKLTSNDTTKSISNFLKNNIQLSKSKNSALVEFSVRSYESKLTASIASAVINTLDETLKENKKAMLSSKKDFINERAKDVLVGLTKLENKLKIFREKNRDISSSPALLLEQSRLIRDVEVQTQIYITLKREFEIAQIEESEKLRLMQVLDPPEIPIYPISPKKMQIVTIGFFLGLFFGITFVFFRTGRLRNYIDNLISPAL